MLLRLLAPARELALAPVSDFMVGAVAEASSGWYYLGFNMEWGGRALQHTVHAEQATVALAHWRGEVALRRVASSSPPCGHCRQFLRETQERPNMQVIVPGQLPMDLDQLLPFSFGPGDLGQTRGILPADYFASDPRHGLSLARAAALRSWAPYSKTLCGVALRSGDRWFPGSSLENAAFNPSLNPLSYALVLARAAGCHRVDEIVCWERAGRISLRAVCRDLASAYPTAGFSFHSE